MNKVVGAAKAVVTAPARITLGFFAGLKYPLRGARFVYLQHPGLVRFWIFPLIITALALFGVFSVVWQYHAALVDLMFEAPTGDGWWDGFLRGLHTFLEVIVTIVLGLLGAFLVAALGSVFAAPFNDALSEEVEHLVTGKAGPGFSWKIIMRDLVRTVLIELSKLAFYLSIMGPLFILQFVVPGVGSAAYTIFGFLFTTIYFAVDYVDWPASRRNRGLRYRLGFVKREFLTMFGFGTGVWLLLFIPLLNLFFMPAAVAGGTLLFLDLDQLDDDDPAELEGVHAG